MTHNTCPKFIKTAGEWIQNVITHENQQIIILDQFVANISVYFSLKYLL